jgi:hypothetical protein
LKFMQMNHLQKCIMDIHDMAEVLQTLRIITNWQAMEASEEKGADSAVPGHLYALLENAVTVFRELVEEETAEILATTSGGGKEEKAMTTDELKKAASAHLKKAMEMVKAHCDHLGAVSKAHMDNVSSLNKAHGAAMDGCGSMTACKALHKAHSTHMEGVHKAHHEHIGALAKAHSDSMSEHFGKADSPAAGSIVDDADNSGQVGSEAVGGGSQGAYPGAPGAAKGVTVEELTKMLEARDEKLVEKMLASNADGMTVLVKALLGGEVVSDAPPAGGVGDRTLIVNKTVHQTHPVTKAGEMTDQGGQPVVKIEPVAQADVVAALTTGDQGALLKMAQGIKANPGGVPASLMSTKLMGGR